MGDMRCRLLHFASARLKISLFVVLSLPVSLALLFPPGMDYLQSTNYWGGDVFWDQTNSEVLTPKKELFCQCTSEYKPVCASMGKQSLTYDNLCLLSCSQRNISDLLYGYEGPCCRKLRCSRGEKPFCDSKGNIYRNRCSFQFHQCEEWKKRKRVLKIGTACPCSNDCPNVFSPVCDTIGNTYKNRCYFVREQCYFKKAYGKTLHFHHHGRCCSNQCRRHEYLEGPLCDSAGRTHKNLCAYRLFSCLARKNGRLPSRIVYLGSCRLPVTSDR
ncbi:kazal type serine protease inhibitor [Trichuris trichiura]|uniref:Kazal type serine protease inhibitor n=1 Tax=Trichuris trichiura TaxID=36087 RepID=A0A077Z0P7_TRITR|nr:kazal type serine protease inhibitor [Trichuris trichiura]